MTEKEIEKQCRKCKYSWVTGGGKAYSACVYILETGERRGCSPDNCEKFENKKKRRKSIGKFGKEALR